MKSKLELISIGVVAKDKPEDSLMLDIFPIEIVPNKQDSPIDKEEISTETINLSKEISRSVVVKQDIIKAKWIPDNSNSIHAPMLGKGERVEIYQYHGRDEFYWRSISNELRYRKNEKTTIVWSNKKTVEDESLLKNVYFLTVDTINKYVRFHTDASDDEHTTYDIDINTKDGSLTIIDGKGNTILLDSANDKLSLKTNKDIAIDTANITTNITKNATTTIGGDSKTDITKNATTTIGGDSNTDITGRYDVAVKKFTLSNGSDELMQLLVDLIKNIVLMKHIGNLGAPTVIDGLSKQLLEQIQTKLEKFI